MRKFLLALAFIFLMTANADAQLLRRLANIADFTGTLTNGQICRYDSSNNELDCDLTCADITGSADLCDGNDASGGGGGTNIDVQDSGSTVSNTSTISFNDNLVATNVGGEAQVTVADVYVLTAGDSMTGTLNFIGSATLQFNGTDLINVSGLYDGEYIQNDTIDDDSIDLVDITLNDFTFDVGSVSKTEYGYLNGVTSAIQTQLDNKQAAAAGS
jgi:hypothetical protein